MPKAKRVRQPYKPETVYVQDITQDFAKAMTNLTSLAGLAIDGVAQLREDLDNLNHLFDEHLADFHKLRRD